MTTHPIGTLNERLTIQTHTPETLEISSITRSSTTATATTIKDHGYATGDWVTIAGADQAAYNGKKQITVTGATTFTYAVSGAPATPATGYLTAVYVSDAQGGRLNGWRTVATVHAELVPRSATERLQAAAIQSPISLRFRVRTRADVTPQQRARWTPRWPPGQAAQTLQIHGVLPVEGGLEWSYLECGRVA